jgi:Cu/Ag efflux protein CusF
MSHAKTAVAAVLVVAWGVALGAQESSQSVTKANQVKATVTIEAINAKTREVTLKNEKGEVETFIVGPDMKRFDELKVGDKVNATYYESYVFQLRKPGEASNAEEEKGVLARIKGELPAAAVAKQHKTTVTVKAVDMNAPSITVMGADGKTVTHKVEDKARLAGVNVGDRIDITYTEALLLAIERSN